MKPVTDPREAPGARHPLVIVHPDTARPALFLGRRRNSYILGLGLAESEALLDRLWAHATQPQFMFWQVWEKGDEEEARKWLERGFRSAKVKVGGGIKADRDRLKAVREAVGPQMKLRADANAGYRVADAIALGKLLEPFELQLLEQPVAVDDLAGMAKVRRSIGMLDEEKLRKYRFDA
jgi:L-alanine-DL-glutamate epimerase-like enolase superfamily enzyme